MTKKTQSKDLPRELRSRVSRAPQKPGVYRWIGKNEEVLYVGKAKDLRNRLKSYLQKPDASLGPWKTALLKHIADVDWTVTETEIEALILETNLIKELKPKYNVLMKDDKNYVYVRMTVKDAYPGFSVVRMIENDGAKYFGPFLTAYKINRTLDMLHTVYDCRACKRSIDQLNKGANAKLKPCLDSQIGKCCGLCDGKVSQKEYRRRIDEVIRFFKGDRKGVQAELKKKMEEAAMQNKFEKAAILRDTLQYIESLDEQQIVSDTSGANTDAIAVALQSGRSQVVVLRERGGRLIGERSYALTGQANTVSKVLEQFLPQYYTAVDRDIPELVLCSEEMDERDILEKWLTEKHGRKVEIKVPERGKKSKLIKMAEENAREKVKQQLAKWEAATQKVEQALDELKDVLAFSKTPKRIECYDISHLGGTETVGSMVVCTNGKADNRQYRSFTIRTMKKGVINDYKAIKEVLVRRLRHLTENRKEWLKQISIALQKNNKLYVTVHPELESTYADRGFRYVHTFPKELNEKLEENNIVMMLEERKKEDISLGAKPDLIVLDGGKGQLSTGVEVLKMADLEIPIIALAKSEEEVFVPGESSPVTFKKDSEGLFLLMRLRDEAHRFANRHRERRLKHRLTE
jgi:excinuclease ABC subunit C